MIYLFLTLALACDDKICDTICKRDGDQKGIIVNGHCGCWNKNDYKPLIKVPKQGAVFKDKRTIYQYTVEQ